jgi:hypothetical protein
VTEDDDVTSNRVVREMESRIRELERQLGRKTLKAEILGKALDKSVAYPRLRILSPFPNLSLALRPVFQPLAAVYPVIGFMARRRTECGNS